MALVRLHSEHDVLQRREGREDGRDLVGTRHPAKRALFDALMRNVLPIQENAAGVRLEFAGQLRNQGAFPGAIRADNGMHFAGADIHVEVVGGG